MADTQFGKVTVYKDDDGDSVLKIYGKLQTDTKLDTEAQTIVEAINELKKLSEGEGGDELAAPWVRPADWPALPTPGDNQVIFLVTASYNSSPYCSFDISTIETNADFPADLTASVEWGDGNISTAIRNDGTFGDYLHILKWTNSFGNNNPEFENPSIDTNAGNYYYKYTGDINDETTSKFWNSGGTKLSDGSMVFIITVTVSDPQNVVIGWPSNSYALEAYIGKNINIEKCTLYTAQMHLQHIKAFGWQPINNKTNPKIDPNSGIFSNCHNLKNIDATEPFTEIPDNMFSGKNGTLEIDLSSVAKIGSGAFYGNIIFYGGALDLPKCTEIRDKAFYGANIGSINIPLVSQIGKYVFYNCLFLKAVNASNAESVDEYAFSINYALKQINMPNLKVIGNYSFANCYSLEEFNFPLLESIGNYAFANCYNLRKIDVPNLIEASSSAFGYCYYLSEVVCPEEANLGAGQSLLWYDNPATKFSRPNDIN